MKKLICIVILFLIMMASFFFFSRNDINTYHTMNLEETLKAKGKEVLFSNYFENDQQVPIYLFWEYGCGYCDQLLDLLNEDTNAYGKYFKLISFEISKDSSNKELFNEMIDFLGLDSHGVPLMIIGEYVYQGYNVSIKEDYLNNLVTIYHQTDRYDIVHEMMEYQNYVMKEERLNTLKPLIYVTILASGIGLFITYKKKKGIRCYEENN